jgi:hypothetical protein
MCTWTYKEAFLFTAKRTFFQELKSMRITAVYMFRPHLALGFIQTLTEMSTRNIKIIMFLGSKVQWVRRADNLTAICESVV